MQKTDPQAALEKLEQLDRARAEERMTLRHKSTGQWAQSKQIRAKYDKDVRDSKFIYAQFFVSRTFQLILNFSESTSISRTIGYQPRLDSKTKERRRQRRG